MAQTEKSRLIQRHANIKTIPAFTNLLLQVRNYTSSPSPGPAYFLMMTRQALAFEQPALQKREPYKNYSLTCQQNTQHAAQWLSGAP